jgi:hypothetical protein
LRCNKKPNKRLSQRAPLRSALEAS